MRLRILVAGMFAAGLACLSNAAAQPAARPPEQDPRWVACNDDARGRPALQSQLDACSSLIQSGQLGLRALAVAYNNRGVTQVRLGRNDLAIADFDHALEADPEFLRAYRNRGDARLTRREYGPAIADYDRAIALSEPDAHLLLRRGRAHFLSGDYRRAIADADQAEQLDPASWRPPSDRADALAASNQLSRAVRDYTRAIELAPDEPWNYMQRAALHTRLGDNRRAEADYREAVQRSPQNADVQNNLCWTIARNGVALEVARMACDTAIRLRADARFFDSRGFVSYKQGRFEDALRDYESALRLDPNRAHSLYGRGLTLSRLDRSAEATADISRAMSLDATIADTYRSYGVGP